MCFFYKYTLDLNYPRSRVCRRAQRGCNNRHATSKATQTLQKVLEKSLGGNPETREIALITMVEPGFFEKS